MKYLLQTVGVESIELRPFAARDGSVARRDIHSGEQCVER
jgi:hypothetical protein